MKKRILFGFIMAAVALLLVVGLTACSGDEAEERVPFTPVEFIDANPDSPVTLTYVGWTNEGTNQAIDWLASRINELYPNITVEVNAVASDFYGAMSSSMSAARLIDVAMHGGAVPLLEWADTPQPWWVDLIEEGYYVDLTDMPFMRHWNQAAVENSMMHNGRVYFVTTSFIGINGIFYNRGMFNEHGWSTPTTWDEFVALGNDIRAAGIPVMTGAGGDGWPVGMILNHFLDTMLPNPYEWSRGLWQGTTALNDAYGVRIYERIAEFISFYEEGFRGLDYGSAIGRFQAGLVAMYPGGTWDGTGILTHAPDMELGFFTLPGDDPAGHPVQMAGRYDLGFAIPYYAPNIQEALIFLHVLSQPENFEVFANLNGGITTMDVPITEPFTASLAPFNQAAYFTFQMYREFPEGVGQFADWEVAWAHLITAGGDMTPQELADAAAADWDLAMGR